MLPADGTSTSGPLTGATSTALCGILMALIAPKSLARSQPRTGQAPNKVLPNKALWRSESLGFQAVVGSNPTSGSW
jgi:hypothetical protein